jgi:FtsZ-binding cell division protein ZapB
VVVVVQKSKGEEDEAKLGPFSVFFVFQDFATKQMRVVVVLCATHYLPYRLCCVSDEIWRLAWAMELERFSIPNENYDATNIEPLVPNRSCVLALEGWNYKRLYEEKINENKKLKSEIFRLKFGLKRSVETVSIITTENKELSQKVNSLNQELYEIQTEFNEFRSQLLLSNRIIENHKISIVKMKESYENYQKEAHELRASRSDNLSLPPFLTELRMLPSREDENRCLKVIIEELKAEGIKLKKSLTDSQVR